MWLLDDFPDFKQFKDLWKSTQGFMLICNNKKIQAQKKF